ncbi:reductase [Fusarium sporotrichioides]|uniref:Reductase n=1 Tax=Fusarium sporotrichioides TaxID=5514 RepID=A0A395S601_FUSSP|nr:reductase [Fusarium sporotrichioides]
MASLPLPNLVSFTKTWHNKPYPFISPTRLELSAYGKNVVITGGGHGIGQAIGVAFAQANAKSVAIVGRNRERLEKAEKVIRAANPSTTVLFEIADTTQRESINQALKNIVDKAGKIDILAANAGILPVYGPVMGYPEEELLRSLMINTMGAFNSIQAFLPLAAPGAKLFNTSSGIGHWQPNETVTGDFAYAAAKAAAIKMFDYVAFENPWLHVVSFQPGIIATGINPDITLGFDTVELPAHFVVWLASKEAEFLKGKFVWANWDVQELMAREDEIKNSMLFRLSLNGVDM